MPIQVLVTGVTGLAGWAFVQEWHQQGPKSGAALEGLISPLSRAPAFWPESIRLSRADLSDPDDVRRMLSMNRWHLIVHADRVCRLKFCEKNPEIARRINVTGTRNLVQAIAVLPVSQRPRLVFCSTDHVFSGNPGEAPFMPDSKRLPITAYGQMMMEAEDIVLTLLEDALIIRNGLLLGRGPLGTTGPVDWLHSRLRDGKPVSLFYNETRTPLGVRCLGRLGARLACSSRRGIVHLSMRTRINRYELGLRIVETIGCEKARHLISKADRCNDSINRVQELILENPDLGVDRPRELKEALAEVKLPPP